ncbi:MAG: hypothetical protein F6K50_26075 [Moorea sp. SIO3I7]|nr:MULTISPECIES: hypothetical protein [unclassified Moorena]NEN98845.1 hypothetical protein [Moorena sp. SIO3I7]NEO09913.1 hypothetical protein [Moorena sp. SIO3I8]NEO20605.1 hypothetical protein [Moorena sp. SIO4A5]NEP25784.1 hypothetical protein [Moorena sp. SIO3I6]NEQ58578.1 hypothetical protein [Moorena sp. SIO4A1]
MGRWGDGEMGEILIKGNYPDMILGNKYKAQCSFISALRSLFFRHQYT